MPSRRHNRKGQKKKIVLFARSHLSREKQGEIVKGYAKREAVRDLHERISVSKNSIYRHYGLIRARLIACRYYTDYPDFPKSEERMYVNHVELIKKRRGIRESNFPFHLAEIFAWGNEPLPALVMRHIRQIVYLTGPFDLTPSITEQEYEVLQYFLILARHEILLAQERSQQKHDEHTREWISRIEKVVEKSRREYLAARKRLWRHRLNKRRS